MAQNQSQNQSSSPAAIPENQTMATVSDSPQTIIANQTTVPVEQTTVTVNQTSKPLQDQSQIQPLGNQTITSEIGMELKLYRFKQYMEEKLKGVISRLDDLESQLVTLKEKR